MSDLPYFDLLLEGRDRGEAAARAFERFVHWGYWERPQDARLDEQSLREAMARLNDEVLKEASLADGQSVLDAGCGFGGTIASVNAARRGMRLAGLNIDGRQLAVARGQVRGASGNELSWVEGDACALPFPDASFDRVLAVECIFHFPSRQAFLKEAARVLKPGGLLALSDFVPPRPRAAGGFLGRWLEREVSKGYGSSCGWPDGDYRAMAARAGLTVVSDRDITRQTLPTYPILLALLAQGERTAYRGRLKRATVLLSWASRLGFVRYRILAFEK